jgi:hypothetical protein
MTRVNLTEYESDLRDAEAFYHWESKEFCEDDFGPPFMRFKLIYEGPLRATTRNDSRVAHKHRIRKAIHKQLSELWKVQFPLPMLSNTWTWIDDSSTGEKKKFSHVDAICDRHNKFGFRFLPLVEKYNGLVCKLSVMFLRRAGPGEILEHGGDLDNRIKTLFDALQIPTAVDDEKPDSDEDPFYCLLENDALITEVSVTADRLLLPEKPENVTAHSQDDVLLIISVETQIADPSRAHDAYFIYS